MCYIGFKLGVWVELMKTAGWLIAGVAGATYYEVVGDFWLQYVSVGPTFAEIASLFLIIIAVLVVTHGLLYLLLHSKRLAEASSSMHIGGVVVGVLRGAVIGGLCLLTLSGVPSEYLRRSIHERSLLGPLVMQGTTQVYETLMQWSPGPGSSTGRLFPF